MLIVTDLSSFDKRSCPDLVVALGNFDGVHLGHHEILRLIRSRARKLGGRAGVFTFREHPQRVLHAEEKPAILTSLVHKLYLLNRTGIDLCFLMEFTEQLSLKSPEAFVREILLGSVGAREICMGFNARFGHNRIGDSRLMKQLAETDGFVFHEAPPFQLEDTVISSSAIRTQVRAGKLDEAARFLGRPYSFFGTVVTGAGRGKALGFPTANLDPHSEVMPPEGVYVCWVRALDCELKAADKGLTELRVREESKRFQALLNYGIRPTFGGIGKAVPEVYILDFKGDLSNKTVEVVIGARLRSERKFPDHRALVKQIEDDKIQARKWFEQNK